MVVEVVVVVVEHVSLGQLWAYTQMNVYLCWTHVQPVHVYPQIGRKINSLSSAICVFLTEWLDSHLASSLQRPSHCSGNTSQAVRWECAA